MVLGDPSGSGAQISPETRRRILQLSLEMGYAANPAARGLAGGRNRLLGVYTFEPTFPMVGLNVYHPFLLGIEQEAARVGYDLLLVTSASVPGERRSIFAGRTNRLALSDGAILLGREDDKTDVLRLAGERFPFVYIGRRDLGGAEMSYVTADYAGATVAVVRHLVGLGHRQIAYLGVPEPAEPSRDRHSGWLRAVRACELDTDGTPTVRSDPEESWPDVVPQLHASGTTAVVVEDPDTAALALSSARAARLAVPGDLSVAVLGDMFRAGGRRNARTGFQMPRVAMGVAAVALLLDVIDAPDEPRHLLLPCRLVPGRTAAPPPAPAR